MIARSMAWALCGMMGPCLAQEMRIAGPVTGLIYDAPSRSVRPILGMPGAARLDSAILADVDWATVAPGGRTVVGVRQGEARLYTNKGETPDQEGTLVTGLAETPQLACWAANSAAVAVYLPSSRSVQWLRLTGGQMAADPAVVLSGSEGPVTAMAADVSSGLIFLAVSGSGVYRLSPSSGPVLLTAAADVPAMALDAKGQTLWIADRANGLLLEMGEAGTDSSTSRVLLRDADHWKDISAVAPSSDGTRLYLASRTAASLFLFDRANGAVSDGIPLDAPATEFTKLGRPSLLLLGGRERADLPVYVMDERSGPAVYFVPPAGGR
jgi:hypothetical protein